MLDYVLSLAESHAWIFETSVSHAQNNYNDIFFGKAKCVPNAEK